MLGADFHKKLSTEPRRRYGEVDDLVDSTTLEECTEPYSAAPTSMKFEEHLLRKWSADLAERRLLVVYSHSQRVIQNVHLALMASSRFDGVSARRLKTEYARKTGSFGYCLARSTSDNETLVLAEARDDYGTQRFMDDLFADSALNWSAHTQRLERQKRCVIVLTTNDHVVRYRGNRGMIPVAEIPFEFALISELELDDVRAAQLAEQFVRRSSAGEFGASRADQAEFLEKRVEDRTFLPALEGTIRATETRVSLGENPSKMPSSSSLRSFEDLRCGLPGVGAAAGRGRGRAARHFSAGKARRPGDHRRATAPDTGRPLSYLESSYTEGCWPARGH